MTTSNYPIVSQVKLGEPSRSGLLGLKRRRTPDTLPSAAAHQSLVYRSDGQLFVDTGEKRDDDPQVLAADHVSLVDLSLGREVVVRKRIPSAEDEDFDVNVAFLCTVDDAVAVVRGGCTSAEERLGSYLRRREKLTRLGQGYGLNQIDEVRQLVQSEVKAYVDVEPPDVHGMTVEYVGTEVPTPASVLEGRAAGRRRGDEIAQTEHEQQLKRLVIQHTNQIMADLGEAIKGRTIEAVYAAAANGEISMNEVLDRIHQLREEELRRQDEREREEREERWRREASAQEAALRKETWDREDAWKALDLKAKLAGEAMKHGHLDSGLSLEDTTAFLTPGRTNGFATVTEEPAEAIEAIDQPEEAPTDSRPHEAAIREDDHGE